MQEWVGQVTHGMRFTKVYEVWKAMIQRCHNPKSKDFKNYGGRGISVCKEWLEFEAFIADMGDRPEGATIERVNVDKGYCKDNCVWELSRTVQAINRRKFKNNKSGYTGVIWHKKLSKWTVYLNVRGNRIYGGVFEDLTDAIEKRKSLEEIYHCRDKGI